MNDVTLAFEDDQVVPPFTRKDTDDTDDADDTDDTDDTESTERTSSTASTESTKIQKNTESTESTEKERKINSNFFWNTLNWPLQRYPTSNLQSTLVPRSSQAKF